MVKNDDVKKGTPEVKKVTSADQLKDRDEPNVPAIKDYEDETPVAEPSSRVETAILERVYDANAKIAQKGETLERIEVFMQDGRPQFWWVGIVKLRKITKEDEEFLLGQKVKEYEAKQAKRADAAIDADEADRANRQSREQSDANAKADVERAARR